eukprot:14676712-Alexandrium_andersonii.AAC.1
MSCKCLASAPIKHLTNASQASCNRIASTSPSNTHGLRGHCKPWRSRHCNKPGLPEHGALRPRHRVAEGREGQAA